MYQQQGCVLEYVSGEKVLAPRRRPEVGRFAADSVGNEGLLHDNGHKSEQNGSKRMSPGPPWVSMWVWHPVYRSVIVRH